MSLTTDPPSADDSRVSRSIALAAAMLVSFAAGRRFEARRTGTARPPRAEERAPGRETDSRDRRRASEPGRGREANAPAEIPARGWKDIAWRVALGTVEDRILANAGGVTFYALLGLFPALATLVSLYGLFADASTIRSHLVLLSNILPAAGIELIGEQIARVAAQDAQTLGLAFFTGFAVSLWSANAGMSALFDALDVVYKEHEKRSLIRFYATTLAFTFASIVFLIFAIAAVVVLPVILKSAGFATTAEQLLAILRWPILFGVVVAGLAIVYRHGPSRRDPKWRWVSWGSVAAALLWIAASMLFSWYVARFDRYNQTYGSLGAAVGFMTWIWISSVVVLFGAELNAEIEHQTAKDSTEGRPKPLGARGAEMADTVGKAQGR
jgi:membrane protein